jgi:hypothetical protein
MKRTAEFDIVVQGRQACSPSMCCATASGITAALRTP